MRAVGVIPARYASVRFPGKALTRIDGVPMLQRVFEGARSAKTLRDVIIATDDERIAEACRAFGAEAVLTRSDHPTGTDRLAEVALDLEDEIIVNIQGDEPLIAGFVVDAAVEEIYRVAKKGLRGLELSCSWDMDPMWHPCWEPLWKAVNDVQLPLHFHTFPTTNPKAREMAEGQVRRAAMFTGVTAFQMGLVHILAAMMGAGVFERYPKLKVSFGESGIGWIPYALDRMDFEWEDRFTDLGLKMKPSDYWRRQCKATFQFDPIGAKLVDDIGAESLMWGSDYPHGDGVWPESDRYIEEQFAGLPPDVVRKITCDNAVEFYRLNG